MLVEIPDPEVILGVILAFIIGLGGLYGYYKIRPFIKSKSDMVDASQSERLEYYERQLIDMKIRLDALEIQGIEQKTEDPNLELKQFLEKLAKNEVQEKEVTISQESEKVPEKPVPTPKIPNIEHTNPTNYVLHLITNKAMTSRDIQVTLKKSREHTSRLMKKLFEEGLVERNTETKPYTYSITEKGMAKVEEVEVNPTVA
ncbi:MarR family transcriptional regulator [Candidatus Nitrosopumilus sp. SW]|uniref:winged helix DNA-binding protein n=1 Tax=Candidatus Nitrosopumilus sp. SW TaxID=2508726 RepID=UPI001154B8D9|nr:winged helix DNA-binding protein [Candidatus Nitrosopumilus sp. SW]QDI88927.1 MarR family transcriptional regulator [Candidatus Nitrosopumilus sp. SW]